MDNNENKLRELYILALNTYGIIAQKWMLVEECSELLDVIAKFNRGRKSYDDIITELADVHIMVEQLSFFYGRDQFLAEKEQKLQRLRERLLNR